SDVEDQRGIGWNGAVGSAVLAIAQVRRNAQLALAANFHSRHAFVPSFDDFAVAQHESERTPRVNRAIEFLASGEPTGVVHSHTIAFLCCFAGAFRDVPILQAGVGLKAIAGDFGW